MAAKQISSADQAAIVLLALGEDIAASLMAQMNANEVRRIALALSRLGHVSEADAAAAMARFEAHLLAPKPALAGGPGPVQRLLERALGAVPESLTAQLDLVTPALQSTLTQIDAQVLADYLQLQLPQVAAVVLAHMAPPQGGQVLRLLPSAQQLAAVRSLATLGPVDAAALAALDEALQELSRTVSHRQRGLGGAAKVAALMNTLDKAAGERLLAGLDERQPELAAEVRASMFRFQDLTKLDDRSLQLLLRKIPGPLLPVALRSAPAEVAAVLYRNMSARAAAMLQDAVSTGPAQRQTDVDAAQQQIAALARALLDAGEVTLAA